MRLRPETLILLPRSRLAVLDKYAHVLSEYQDHELHGVRRPTC